MSDAAETIHRLWAATQGLTLEEKGMLFEILLCEARSGKELRGSDEILSRVLGTSTRKYRRLRAALGDRGVIDWNGETLRSRVASPFENMKYVKLYGRQAIPAELRLAVYERDGFACVDCGAQANLSCDHEIPVTSGGETSLKNLRTRCMPCNLKKGSKNARSAA